MKIVLIIARNTYKEIIRDRVLYGLLIFAVLLIGLSLAVGQLSYAEQIKISIDFGMAGIHMSSVILSVFVGSTLVSRELEKKTILTLFARPIHRFQFVFGKFIGLELVLLMTIFSLSLILLFILYKLDHGFSLLYAQVVFGIFLESSVLLGVALFLSSFVSPMVVVSTTIGIFFIGHWLDSLMFFSGQSDSVVFRFLGVVLSRIIPNLETVNWRSLLSYQDQLSLEEFFRGSLYMISWVGVLLMLTTILFQRREFV